jgi:LAS superfamily LD-carboxypeptidase LdcB
MNVLETTGRARTHIIDLEEPRCSLHFEAVASFQGMRDMACRDGIDLRAVSSYRDFSRQLQIWNAKWRGERPLYARDGSLLEHARLSEAELVDAILSWSAIPGGSRHHWGSDIDVIDAAALPEGYRVQLLPSEYAPDGVFARLTRWLDAHMTRFGFFRPYGSNRGGAGVEPWHLSYAPVAVEAMEALSLSVLRSAIVQGEMLGKEVVLDRLPEIYTRFILAVDPSCATGRRERSARA